MIKSGQLIRIYTRGTTKAPASHHTTRAAGEREDGRGLGFIIWFTAKCAKTAKDSTAMALRP
ncbi:MAG: hypothetical protein K8R08_11070 [Methanosarcinales archaeon]|nr:hypothetical protein [Methanosarcinales archaeon]